VLAESEQVTKNLQDADTRPLKYFGRYAIVFDLRTETI